MSDELLRLAHAGLHPHAVREALVARSSGSVLAKIAGSGSSWAAGEVAVSAASRRARLRELGADFVPRSELPPILAERPDSPEWLFARGRIPEGPTVAVVGTRRCTAYGRRLATDYGRAVAEAGWVLVSGLARGIDGCAHTGTVAGGGRGIAVLGSGIDVIYPREHARLAADLLALGGALVTEYPPGARPEPWRFPPRNRVISGLARAVVVVEAGERGGALITANCALDHANFLFAVPGDVERAASRGCNLLIRDGAHPVLDPDDLVEALSLVLGPPQTRLEGATSHLVQQEELDQRDGHPESSGVRL